MRFAPTPLRMLATAASFVLVGAFAIACTDAGDDDDTGEGEGEAAEGEGEAGEGEGEGGEGEGEGEAIDGFGVISGDCDVVTAVLADAAPADFTNQIDFGTNPYDDADRALLTASAQQLAGEGNGDLAGGALLAQVFAVEVLARCERAVLVKKQLDVEYDEVEPPARTDLLVEIDGQKVGVRVLRAFALPPEEVALLVEGALDEILLSSEHVADSDRWVKQILAIVASSDEDRALVDAALDGIDRGTRADTIVVVTVTSGDDAFLYD